MLQRCLLLVLSALISYKACAVETITINRGHYDPIPIAVNYFAYEHKNDKLSEQLMQVISNDLKRSGLFRAIPQAAFIENEIGIRHKPLFAAWRQINANLLLNGEVIKLSNNVVKVSFVLWDTVLGRDVLGEEFEAPIQIWRRIAHKIADKVYEKVTGDVGYFDTKIAYIAESGPVLKRVKRLAIMDHDGANHRYLTNGSSLVLTPRFSPKADKILYVSYQKRIPYVYMHNVKTGKEVVLGHFPGMTFAPRFSPNGRSALISLARNGATHIYEIDLNTLHAQQLTSGDSINTSPSYSPDAKRIVFNSDRSGSRQLYTMNSDGSNIQRISFGGGRYATPIWSPRGDLIAFTKISQRLGFTIGVMRAESTDPEMANERILARGYLVEGPSWAQNGRMILFTKSQPPSGNVAGRSRIYSVDVTGYNEQEIPTPQDASDGDWSNLLD